MKLPNGQRADLGTKLEDYTLNPLHRQGLHKARVFAAVLGITVGNSQVLERAILSAAEDSPAAEFKGENGFGATYQLCFQLTTDRGTATVLTGRIIRHGEDFPRLTTCFIL